MDFLGRNLGVTKSLRGREKERETDTSKGQPSYCPLQERERVREFHAQTAGWGEHRVGRAWAGEGTGWEGTGWGADRAGRGQGETGTIRHLFVMQKGLRKPEETHHRPPTGSFLSPVMAEGGHHRAESRELASWTSPHGEKRNQRAANVTRSRACRRPHSGRAQWPGWIWLLHFTPAL